MEKIPDPVQNQEEKDYFSMSLEEVEKLSSEELAEAAKEAGVSPEKFLKLKRWAHENSSAGEPSVPSSELLKPPAQETDFHRILRELPDFRIPTTVTEEEREEAERAENDAYKAVDRLASEKLHSATQAALQRKVVELFLPQLRIRFIDLYASYVNRGSKDAFESALRDMEEMASDKGANIYELYKAYRRLDTEMKQGRKLSEAIDAYLNNTATEEQNALLQSVRRVAYRGLNKGGVSGSMLDDANLYGYMRHVPQLIYEKAKKLGLGSSHSGPAGSAEKFSTDSPDAFSRQNRPRRYDDDLGH